MLPIQEEFARALVGPDKAVTARFLDSSQPREPGLSAKAAALATALLAGISFNEARAGAGHSGGKTERKALQAYEAACDALPAALSDALPVLMRKVLQVDATVARPFLQAQVERGNATPTTSQKAS